MKAEQNIFVPKRPLSKEQQELIGKMKTEIISDSVKAVSFELFETLALRPFFDRTDLFFFMEQEFSGLYVGNKTFYELRCDAEERAEKKLKEGQCLTLEKIYDELEKISKISPSSREKLLKRECALEEYFCFARECGRELYNTARKNGKKIIITADTYLPRKTVEKIISVCGYTEYDGLFVTSDCGASKIPDGALFSHMCNEMKLAPQSIRHFGSSFEADAEAPVKQGVKAVYLTSCRDRLIKSGRICGYIQKLLIYEFCTPEYLALRCVMGLYAAYAFDYPQGKAVHSDFCADEYMIGFLCLGALSLYKDFVIDSQLQAVILGAMSENEKMTAGRDDFVRFFDVRFGSGLDKYGYEGCELPFRFFAEHGSLNDRMSVQQYISADVMENWSKDVIEPEIAPVYTKAAKKTALSKLADRVATPGTHLRTVIDGIISKLR